MRPAVSALQVPFDVGVGGVVLANMLVAWLDGDPTVLPIGEVVDESQDHGTSPQPTSLHLLTPVDAEPSSPPPGEHGTPVCAPREGAGTGLERIPNPHAGSGLGEDGDRNRGTGGLQNLGGGGLDGASGRGVCLGSLPAGAFESRLASAAGVVRTHRNAGDRRRWLLRSGGFQRRIAARTEGRNGPGRAAFSARAPPRGEAQQGEERRVALSHSGWFLLRRKRLYHPGPGPRSAGRGQFGIPPLSRNGQRLWSDATIRGKRVTLSQAVLWRGLGWQDHMGSTDAWSCAEHAEETLLCRDVCLWPLSVSPPDQPRGRSSETDPDGRHVGLACQPERAPRGVYHFGRILSEPGALGQEPNQWRGDPTAGPSARGLGSFTRATVVRHLWPRPYRALYRQRRHLSLLPMQPATSRGFGEPGLH